MRDYWVWKLADFQSGSANMDIILVELVFGGRVQRGQGRRGRSGWDGPVAPPGSFEIFYPFRIPQILGNEGKNTPKNKELLEKNQGK